MKSYKVYKITGDRYAGIWPVEMFGKFNVNYEQSAAPKSDLYRDLLPLLNSTRVELLDHTRLINQLTGLERRTARGGKDSIDHAPGGHDDLANVVAGLSAVQNKYGNFDVSYSGFQPNADDKDGEKETTNFATEELRSAIMNGYGWGFDGGGGRWR